MKLAKDLCRQAIQIDAQAEPSFGSDQAYETYPVRFPTVNIALMATDALINLAGVEGEFYIGLNGYTRTGVDNAIVCVKGDEETCDIDLDEDAQTEVRTVLDKQLLARFGLDCAGLLGRGAEAASTGV